MCSSDLKTIKKVSKDTDALAFNTAISQMMVFSSELAKLKTLPRVAWETMIKLIGPYAPHLAEELWERSGHGDTLAYEAWPVWDEALTKDDEVTIVVQILGRVRHKFMVAANTPNAELEKLATEADEVQKFIQGKDIKKVIVVPNKLVNIVL